MFLPKAIRLLPLLSVACGFASHSLSGDSPALSEDVAAKSGARYAGHYRLVVDFDDDIPHSRVAALASELHAPLRAVSDYVDADEIYTIDTDAPEAVLATLRARPDVEAAEFEMQYSIPFGEESVVAAKDPPAHSGFPNDPKFPYQWHLKQMGATRAWDRFHGDGVIVAVIDTGIAKVPDLKETKFVAGYNFVTNTADATDDHGHGTHVAGTVAQSTNNAVGVAGVAFSATLMPIKVLSAQGSGSTGGIAEGIRWAVDHGAKVLNLSLGGPLGSSVLKNAIKYAHEKGAVVVCAAGNDGRGKVSFPAAFPFALAVAATQFDETTTFYSNWGPEIDIAAPGGNVRVDQNNDGMPDGVLQNTLNQTDRSKDDYLLFMGTSMAAPHVAGAAAIIMSSGITQPDAVEAALTGAARKPQSTALAADEYKKRYGSGIVDVGGALQGAATTRGGFEFLGAFAVAGIALFRRRAIFGARGIFALIAGVASLFAAPLFAPQFLAGNPLLLSVLIPLGAVALFYSFRSWRGAIAGVCFAFAGVLVAELCSRTVDVRFIPDTLDGAWLSIHAFACAALGRLVARRA